MKSEINRYGIQLNNFKQKKIALSQGAILNEYENIFVKEGKKIVLQKIQNYIKRRRKIIQKEAVIP